MIVKKMQKITAADDDFNFDDEILDDADDELDALEDDLGDLEGEGDEGEEPFEVEEDDPSIEIDNNIEDHYIAECDRCHGIFISAMIESDQQIESIHGICPLCNKESEQFLNWIVRSVEYDDMYEY